MLWHGDDNIYVEILNALYSTVGVGNDMLYM